MGNLYNEIVIRKKLPVFFALFTALLVVIVASDLVANVRLGGINLGGYSKILFFVTLVGFSVYEILRCNIRYRYSIIADQLVIKKSKGENENLVEIIKMKDIVFIGRPKDIKEKYTVENTKKYVCSFMGRGLNCCIYKDGSKYKKLYFEASCSLVENIKTLVDRQKSKKVC